MTSLDAELRSLAIALLREVARRRKTNLFTTELNNPELRPSAEGAGLMVRAEEIVTLAQRVGEDTSELAATKILRAFRGANDLTNHHRLGPIRLAASLLEELEARD